MRILITGGSGFIGTNLIEKLALMEEHTVLNLDISKPNVSDHSRLWEKCDILDINQVTEKFELFKPEVVIHLAARTDTDARNLLDDYKVNTEGSRNILDAIKQRPYIKRAIITSTQFVNQYHGFPKDDEDYAPHTVYGESKVIMEQMTRAVGLSCIWTIIRPTNIWGPWHLRYPYEFWRVVSKGLYFHPGHQPVIRSYGYVGNVVFQIISILNTLPEKINGKVFYVGDMPTDIYNWVNGFSIQQTGKKVKVVPRIVVRTLGLVGDALTLIGLKFPITTSRYKSMTTSNMAPMQPSFDVLGKPPYSLEQGIDETIRWMKLYHPKLIK